MAEKLTMSLVDYARMKRGSYTNYWGKAKCGALPGAFRQGRRWMIEVEENELIPMEQRLIVISDSIDRLNDLHQETSDRLDRIESRLAAFLDGHRSRGN
jgi:hypothetical protein